MKSGPTLAAATFVPLDRRAAIRPVATVVFPTPDDVPATTSRGPRTGTAGCWHVFPRKRFPPRTSVDSPAMGRSNDGSSAGGRLLRRRRVGDDEGAAAHRVGDAG